MEEKKTTAIFEDGVNSAKPQFGDVAHWAHYYTIEKLLKHISSSVYQKLSLDELASMAGMSPSYLQRIFSEYVGLSPKQFQQFLRANLLKTAVKNGQDLWSEADELGLQSNSRTYELLVKAEAITPSTLQKKGKGLSLNYDYGQTPFGSALFVESKYGLTHLFFLENEQEAVDQVKSELPLATFEKTDGIVHKWVQAVFVSKRAKTKESLYLHLRGTPFQLKVWQALLAVPEKQFSSYGQIAQQIGNDKASRAVGTAVGSNAISWLVPCHRVLRQSGIIGDYRWGSERKKIMLFCESNAIF